MGQPAPAHGPLPAHLGADPEGDLRFWALSAFRKLPDERRDS